MVSDSQQGGGGPHPIVLHHRSEKLGTGKTGGPAAISASAGSGAPRGSQDQGWCRSPCMGLRLTVTLPPSLPHHAGRQRLTVGRHVGAWGRVVASQIAIRVLGALLSLREKQFTPIAPWCPSSCPPIQQRKPNNANIVAAAAAADPSLTGVMGSPIQVHPSPTSAACFRFFVVAAIGMQIPGAFVYD